MIASHDTQKVKNVLTERALLERSLVARLVDESKKKCPSGESSPGFHGHNVVY